MTALLSEAPGILKGFFGQMWHMPVVPTSKEAEAGRLLEPVNSRPAWKTQWSAHNKNVPCTTTSWESGFAVTRH